MNMEPDVEIHATEQMDSTWSAHVIIDSILQGQSQAHPTAQAAAEAAWADAMGEGETPEWTEEPFTL